MRIIVALLLSVYLAGAASQIIETSNRLDWATGTIVGVRGGPFTNSGTIRDVTQAPYSADNTGVSSAVSAIESAIAASSSNDVVYVPDGIYKITAGLTLNKTGVTIRGSGTNAILFGHITMGRYSDNSTWYYNVASGATRGSTSMDLLWVTNSSDNAIRKGDMLSISCLHNPTNELFQVIGVQGQTRMLKQTIVVIGASGTNITFTPPLVFDFTNSPVLDDLNIQSYNDDLIARNKLGLENITITGTNNGSVSANTWGINMNLCFDSWVRNVNSVLPLNYCIQIDNAVNCTVEHNWFGQVGAGTSHAGIIAGTSSGLLIENNIVADVGTTGIMFNDEFCGNAIFGNFVTNCSFPVGSHNAHPMFNLFEGGSIQSFMMDGYFGSGSHNTLFRNRIINTTSFKRFSSFMQVVGNVAGNLDYSYIYTTEVDSYGSPYPIFEIGYPNLGNSGYDGVSPPIAWNFPGREMDGYYGGEHWTNGQFTFTGNYGPTNVLWTNMGTGTFTNIPAPVVAGYPLIFQSGGNTNFYYAGTNQSPVLTTGAGTPSNVTLTVYVYVTNGSTLYIAGQLAYQQLQQTNKSTHNITGNLVYTNTPGTLVWSANTNRVIPSSLLYPSGAPSWWGTNRWPAADPENATVPYAAIPAEDRYFGIASGGGSQTPSTSSRIGSGRSMRSIR